MTVNELAVKHVFYRPFAAHTVLYRFDMSDGYYIILISTEDSHTPSVCRIHAAQEVESGICWEHARGGEIEFWFTNITFADACIAEIKRVINSRREAGSIKNAG
jgi:hypothetical protein